MGAIFAPRGPIIKEARPLLLFAISVVARRRAARTFAGASTLLTRRRAVDLHVEEAAAPERGFVRREVADLGGAHDLHRALRDESRADDRGDEVLVELG